MNGSMPLHLFTGIGVELEYMIVSRDTLSVMPVTDELLRSVAGEYTDELEQGDLSWSNELVLHVVELKTNGPAPSVSGLAARFQSDVGRIVKLLEPLGARLMPTAAHPWMNPDVETVLWPHEYNAVYESFNRIFGCHGHGWSNLQCTHLNLPFAGDDEFGRLHAAIRLVLPIIPAIAASSPILDGKPTGFLDSRLNVYRDNARRIPMVTGSVVPEPVYTRGDYAEKILEPLYADIAPHDPNGILRYEWLNARGAIARFDRHALEIRIVDIQECPAADMAVANAIVQVLQALVEERWQDVSEQMSFDTERLNRILMDTTKRAEHAVLTDEDYLRVFGWDDGDCPAGELWQYLADVVIAPPGVGDEWSEARDTILYEGSLAARIMNAVGKSPTRQHLFEVYQALCESLESGTMFHA